MVVTTIVAALLAVQPFDPAKALRETEEPRGVCQSILHTIAAKRPVHFHADGNHRQHIV
jgi:hypothetical protein